jgi:hypothetical protein
MAQIPSETKWTRHRGAHPDVGSLLSFGGGELAPVNRVV